MGCQGSKAEVEPSTQRKNGEMAKGGGGVHSPLSRGQEGEEGSEDLQGTGGMHAELMDRSGEQEEMLSRNMQSLDDHDDDEGDALGNPRSSGGSISRRDQHRELGDASARKAVEKYTGKKSKIR